MKAIKKTAGMKSRYKKNFAKDQLIAQINFAIENAIVLQGQDLDFKERLALERLLNNLRQAKEDFALLKIAQEGADAQKIIDEYFPKK